MNCCAKHEISYEPVHFFRTSVLSERDDSLDLSSYISELQSISKRFTAAKNSNVARDVKIHQITALQVSLAKMQSMPLKRGRNNSSFEDVRRYATAIMQHMCEWQLRCQELSLDNDTEAPGMSRRNRSVKKSSERSV